MQQDTYFDYLIVGGGVVGLALAHALQQRKSGATIGVLEKEASLAQHSSGRNSGVLHAGFYYSADSLKAKFCVAGNRLWRQRCEERGIRVVPCGKVVVAKDEEEQKGVRELFARGQRNGVKLQLVDAKELSELEPLAKTSGIALFSPDTAVLDPIAALEDLAAELRQKNVRVLMQHRYVGRGPGKTVETSAGRFGYGTLINAAGLYADRVARDYGLAKKFIVMPFKGLYLKDTSHSLPLRRHVYPVPNLQNPFLGVHFTITADGATKIGPTAIPSFWRENYQGWENFSAQELLEVLRAGASLFWHNAFGFRALSYKEMKKYRRAHLFGLAKHLVPSAQEKNFATFARPGIRAQLLDLEKKQLVQDFLVEKAEASVHVLNAVSPGFTASLSFADWIVEKYT